MSKSSHHALASGAINASGDSLEVVLVQPADNPTVIMIRWPDAAPSRFNAVAAEIMRLLAAAGVITAGVGSRLSAD